MNVTPEIVKNLLETLVTPDYKGVIDDYMVEVFEFDKGAYGVVVGVIVNPEYNDYSFGSNYTRFDYKIIDSIKKVMKYLSPTITTDVNLYVIEEDSSMSLVELLEVFLKSDYVPEEFRDDISQDNKTYKIVHDSDNMITIKTNADADLLNGELKSNLMEYLSNNMEINPDLQIIFKN
jgi:hypothetical protein